MKFVSVDDSVCCTVQEREREGEAQGEVGEGEIMIEGAGEEGGRQGGRQAGRETERE